MGRWTTYPSLHQNQVDLALARHWKGWLNMISQWQAEREVEHLQPFLKRGAAEDQNLTRSLQELLSKAYNQGVSDKANEERREAEADRRNAWESDTWDRELTQRLARFIAVLGETMPVPALTRAAKVAPALGAPDWSVAIAEQVRSADHEEAKSILADLKKAATAPSQPQRSRSSGGSDNAFITGFVLGGLFF